MCFVLVNWKKHGTNVKMFEKKHLFKFFDTWCNTTFITLKNCFFFEQKTSKYFLVLCLIDTGRCLRQKCLPKRQIKPKEDAHKYHLTCEKVKTPRNPWWCCWAQWGLAKIQDWLQYSSKWNVIKLLWNYLKNHRRINSWTILVCCLSQSSIWLGKLLTCADDNHI